MTPFRNDDSNPFNRASVWPKMPQAPIRLGPLPKASASATRVSEPPAPVAEEPQVFAEPVEPDVLAGPIGSEFDVVTEQVAPEPAQAPPAPRPVGAPPIGARRSRPPRGEVRLTPLIAAAAVGAGATAALFLMVGFGESAKPVAAPQTRSTLAVGDLVASPAPPVASAAPPPAAPLATPRPPARLAAAEAVRRPRTTTAEAAPSTPLVSVPTAEPVAISLQPPPAATLAPPAAPFVPPPRPDPLAPIVTHGPDGS